MEEETTLENRQGCYAHTWYEDIAILRFGKDFLFESIDLSVSNRLFDVFERISQSSELLKTFGFFWPRCISSIQAISKICEISFLNCSKLEASTTLPNQIKWRN